MAIKEQIGYPDYILEDQNEKLDQEYANVSMLCEPQYKSLHLFPCHLKYLYLCNCHFQVTGQHTKLIVLNILISKCMQRANYLVV